MTTGNKDTGGRDWDEDRADRFVLLPTWGCLAMILTVLLASGCLARSGWDRTGSYMLRNGQWVPVLKPKAVESTPATARVLTKPKWL